LGRIGHLIGYNVPFLPGQLEELQEEENVENLKELLDEYSADGISCQDENEDEPSSHDENEEVVVPIIRANPGRGLEESE
jgi:hypothetical protein